MYSAFIRDCGYDNSTNNLIGNVYCPNTKCSSRLCLHKKTFQSLGRSDYHCPPMRVCVPGAQNFLLKFKENPFFLSVGQGVYIFERAQNQLKMLLEMCIVLASIVPTEKKTKLLTVM